MLGVANTATEPQIQAAYFKLAKVWHPDRLPAELQPLKSDVSTVFAKLNEAYGVLSDAAKRTSYVATLGSGSNAADEAAIVNRVMDAAIEFQKAEVLVRRNNLIEAEQYAGRAALADPEQPDYVVLLTWIKALRRGDPPAFPEGKTSTHYDDLLVTLDGVLQKHARLEKALFYRATLLKKTGREERAIRDFRVVVQINPKNIDAVREVRLAQMRRDAKKKDEGGILGKLFKK